MNEKKITFIVLGILVSGLIVFGLSSTTYALFSSTAYGTNTEAYSTGLLTIEAKSKSDTISLSNALPMTDEDGLETNPYVFTIKNIGNLDYQFDVKLLSNGTQEETFPYELIKLQINNGEVTTLANLTSGKLNDDKITLLAGETIDFSIRIWLSIDTSNEYINRTFDSKIVVDGQAVYTSSNNEIEGVKLIKHITDLYMNNKDATPVTNNSIDYTYASIYDKDTDDTTSGGLMNDRLGGTTSDYDAGNIRYYGANPNNYIDIGDVYPVDIKNWVEPFQTVGGFPETMIPKTGDECQTFMTCSNLVDLGMFSDATTCEAQVPYLLQSVGYSTIDELCTFIPAGTPKLYRIIGLFKDIEKEDGTTEDLIKIIREESIGNFAWDLTSDDSGYAYSNDWSNSTLQQILNNEYYNSGSVNHIYVELSTEEYVDFTTDFSKKGLNSSIHRKIESVKWNLGGWNTNQIYANQIYGYERGEAKCTDCNYETVWPGKIALMYPSDYGYAVDFNNCSETLSDYSYDRCKVTNWMFDSEIIPLAEWLLTPYSDVSNAALLVAFGGLGYEAVYPGIDVRPAMFLNSKLSIESGDGSKTNPYIVR